MENVNMSSKVEKFEKFLESTGGAIDVSHLLKDKNRLGVGANGEVYSLGKYVLKITDPDDAIHETKFLNRATGQNARFKRIQSYYGYEAVIVSTEKYWRTLFDVIFVDNKPFSSEELLELFGTIMVELERLHFRGVCHGDVHSGNIMFTHKNNYSSVSFIDFGHAGYIENNEDTVSDVEGVIQLCQEAMDNFEYDVNGVWIFLRNLYRKQHEARSSNRVLRSGKVVKKCRLN